MVEGKDRIRVGIIGFSGVSEQEDPSFWNETAYKQMIDFCDGAIRKTGLSPVNVELVTGGFPWSDHVAVTLFNYGGYSSLVINSPAKFKLGGFGETSEPGCDLNKLHQSFLNQTGIDSLLEIRDAVFKGAVMVDSHKDLRSVYKALRQCKYIISLAKDDSENPDKCTKRMIRWKDAEFVKICKNISKLRQ